MTPAYKPGIYFDLAEHLYRSAPGISQSSLKPILRSPAHFKAGIEEEDEKETEAILIGRMAGQLLMEPNREPWWTIQPDKS
jgi:hypothetical protein